MWVKVQNKMTFANQISISGNTYILYQILHAKLGQNYISNLLSTNYNNTLYLALVLTKSKETYILC